MRVFLTGATGFVGGRIAALLRARGDEVAALVRDRDRAGSLERIGCELVEGDLDERAAISRGLSGAGAAIHCAAIYEVGAPESRHEAMWRVNVEGAERVLGAALEAGTARVAHISTVAAYGNTHGRVVDESHEHPGIEFTSYYERTKVAAQAVARRLSEAGLPCVIVQPGSVYGPGDSSPPGKLMRDLEAGRLRFLALCDVGLNMVHVDDVAAGTLLALERGRVGARYVLGGEITTLRRALEAYAAILGRRPPRFTVPTALLRALVPAGPLIGRLMGQPPNLRELISSSDGVTFWARHDRAVAELGYAPRDLDRGLRDMLAAGGGPMPGARASARRPR